MKFKKCSRKLILGSRDQRYKQTQPNFGRRTRSTYFFIVINITGRATFLTYKVHGRQAPAPQTWGFKIRYSGSGAGERAHYWSRKHTHTYDQRWWTDGVAGPQNNQQAKGASPQNALRITREWTRERGAFLNDAHSLLCSARGKTKEDELLLQNWHKRSYVPNVCATFVTVTIFSRRVNGPAAYLFYSGVDAESF